MKRAVLLTAAVAFTVLMLAACTANNTTKSSASSKNSIAKLSSSSLQADGMEPAEIAEGDFSSVQGVWKDSQGRVLSFTKDSISLDGVPLDILSTSTNNVGQVSFTFSGFGAFFLPAGETNSDTSLTDLSDKSRDRVFLGQVWTDGSNAFYKVD
jgi:hypothetical protein